jgi:hypothetical protein
LVSFHVVLVRLDLHGAGHGRADALVPGVDGDVDSRGGHPVPVLQEPELDQGGPHHHTAQGGGGVLGDVVAICCYLFLCFIYNAVAVAHPYSCSTSTSN